MSFLRSCWRRLSGNQGRAIERLLEEQRTKFAELQRQTEKNSKTLEGKISLQQKKIEKEVRRVARVLEGLDSRISSKQGLINRVERCRIQLDNLSRRELLSDYPYADSEHRFWNQRASLHSQNGEDGLVLELIRAIGNPHRKTIEMCCGDNGGNSGALIFELGWSGLLVDGDQERLDRLRDKHSHDPDRVKLEQAWITCENVNDLIRNGGVSGPVDLLSVDVDGVDYWLWQAIDACTPDIVIAEYNASFGPERSVTVPYAPDFARPTDFRLYYGASLTALERLGRTKGYRLIGVEPRGVNAFFLRDELLADEYPAKPASDAFRTLDKHVLYQKKKGYSDFFAELESRGLPIEDVSP